MQALAARRLRGSLAAAASDAPAPGDEQWTAALVAVELIAAFRLFPHTAIFSPHRNALEPVRPDIPAAPLNFVLATAKYLRWDSDERLMLLTWARAKASGDSIRDICRQQGWSRNTFERRHKAACRTIAAGLNRDGVALW